LLAGLTANWAHTGIRFQNRFYRRALKKVLELAWAVMVPVPEKQAPPEVLAELRRLRTLDSGPWSALVISRDLLPAQIACHAARILQKIAHECEIGLLTFIL